MASNEQIAIQVTDQVAGTIAGKLDAITKSAIAGHGAIQQLQQSLNALGKANSSGLNGLQQAVNQTATAANSLTQAFKNASTAANQLNNTNVRLTTQTRSLGSEIGSLATKLGAFVSLGATVKELIDLGDAYTSLQNKLVNVTTSQAQVNALTERLFDISNQTRTSVDATSTAFVRFDRALALMGKSQEDSLRLTQTINEALVVGGATAQEASSALLQLSQAFNSGKLQGDEFRSVSENMPIVLDAVAKALGKSTSEVKALSTQGKITADVLYKAFALIQDEVDNKFAKTIPTVSQAITVLKNNVTQFWGELNKAGGFTETLAQGIIALGQHLGSVAIVLTAALIPALVAGASAALEFTAALALNPLGAAVIAITAVSVALYENRDALIDVGNEQLRLGDVMIGAWQTFKAALQPIFDAISTGWSSVMSLLGSQTTDFVTAAKSLFMDLVVAIVSIPAALKAVWDQAKDLADGSLLNIDSLRKRLDQVRKDTKAAIADNAAHNAAKNNAASVTSAATSLRGAGKNTQVTPPDKNAEKRAEALAKVNAELDKQLKYMFELNPQRTIDQQFDQIQIQLASKKITLNASEAASIKAKITQIEQNKIIQQQLDQIYNNATQSTRDYSAAQTAALMLLQKGAITADQYAGAVAHSTDVFRSSVEPLYTFNKGIQEQLKVLSQVGPEQETERQIIQAKNDALSRSVILTDAQVASMRAQLEIVQQVTNVSQALNNIYDNTVGKQNQLAASAAAVVIAFNKGYLSAEQYGISLNKISVEAANLKLQMGDATWADGLLASLGKITESYQGVASGASAAFGDFFTSFTDGFANSIGAAIVGTESFSEALHNVAQQALGSLISALVKLGIQYLVNAAISETAQATTTAASVAAAATTAAAWAPAAAAVSLATFGANAAGAATGMTATFGLADILAAMPGFALGGYTGNGATNDVAGVVHGKEYVFDAASTQRIGVDNLDAMRSGYNPTSDSGGGNRTPNITINNTGTPQTYQVQSMSRDEIRLIARDEVTNTAPSVVAQHINNPNSSVSKSIQRNTTARRNR